MNGIYVIMSINWDKEIKSALRLLQQSNPNIQEAIVHLESILKQNAMLSSTDRVLVMDDNLDMLELLQEILTGHGYEVVCVSHGDAALEELRKQNETHFHAVILDLVVRNGKGGLSVLSEIRESYPHLTIVLSSGHPIEMELLKENKDFILLNKPWRTREILQILERGCAVSRENYFLSK